MEKRKLASILSEVLVPIGFKKKGDYWIVNGNLITKMVNLQKSKFSNRFYINYGYILNAIPLNNLLMHIFKGIDSIDSVENNRIKELLDLENNISSEDREKELKKLFVDKLITDFQSVNTEEDLLNELKSRPHLNDIPLVVKKYFLLTN